MLTEEQMKKLPRYAQDEINQLRQEIRGLHDAFNGVFGCSHTGVEADCGMNQFCLPFHARIIFYPEGKEKSLYYYQVYMKDGNLHVSSGFDTIAAVGEASNYLRIIRVPRR